MFLFHFRSHHKEKFDSRKTLNFFTTNGSSITTSLNSNTGILNFLISDGISYTFLSTSTIKKILGFETDITSSTFITMPW